MMNNAETHFMHLVDIRSVQLSHWSSALSINSRNMYRMYMAFTSGSMMSPLKKIDEFMSMKYLGQGACSFRTTCPAVL